MPAPDSKYEPEDKRNLDAVISNCDLLVRGYREKVDYIEMVKYHGITCPLTGTGGDCECRTEKESRTRNVHRPGLLTQLQNFNENRDCDLNPKGARGAPRVKKFKLNPELNGMLTLDEIICDVNMALDRIFEEAGRDRTWLAQQKAEYSITGLPQQCRYMLDDEHTGAVAAIARLTGKWVDMARRTLNHKVADTMFDGVVCGNCEGALAAPARIEGESAAVRCVGTLTAPPCGHSYPASEWLALLEGKA